MAGTDEIVKAIESLSKTIEKGFSSGHEILNRLITAFERLRNPLIAIAICLALLVSRGGLPFGQSPLPHIDTDQKNTLTVETDPSDLTLATKPWLTSQEYLKLIGRNHPDTAYEHIKSGKVEAIKEGRAWRIKNPFAEELAENLPKVARNSASE